MRKFKEGDTVILIKTDVYLRKDEFKVGNTYIVDRYNLYSNDLLYLQGNPHPVPERFVRLHSSVEIMVSLDSGNTIRITNA